MEDGWGTHSLLHGGEGLTIHIFTHRSVGWLVYLQNFTLISPFSAFISVWLLSLYLAFFFGLLAFPGPLGRAFSKACSLFSSHSLLIYPRLWFFCSVLLVYDTIIFHLPKVCWCSFTDSFSLLLLIHSFTIIFRWLYLENLEDTKSRWYNELPCIQYQQLSSHSQLFNLYSHPFPHLHSLLPVPY